MSISDGPKTGPKYLISTSDHRGPVPGFGRDLTPAEEEEEKNALYEALKTYRADLLDSENPATFSYKKFETTKISRQKFFDLVYRRPKSEPSSEGED